MKKANPSLEDGDYYIDPNLGARYIIIHFYMWTPFLRYILTTVHYLLSVDSQTVLHQGCMPCYLYIIKLSIANASAQCSFQAHWCYNSLRWPMLQGLSSNLPISHHRLWCQFQPISLTLNLDIFSRYLQCNLSPSRLDLYLPSVICNMLLVVVIHILMYLCLSIICKCC